MCDMPDMGIVIFSLIARSPKRIKLPPSKGMPGCVCKQVSEVMYQLWWCIGTSSAFPITLCMVGVTALLPVSQSATEYIQNAIIRMGRKHGIPEILPSC
jgi:hypothetical protein